VADHAALTLALTTGMVAAFNPCGFAMLPAYVSFFLGTEQADRNTGRALLRAFPVGLAMTGGFIVVFTAIGTVLRPLQSQLTEHAPWATIVIGAALLVLGVAMLRGFDLNAQLPKLGRGGRSGSLRSMFVFGVSYAIASLSCTLPIFLANIANSFRREGVVGSIGIYVAYAVGMGLIVLLLTVALALAKTSIVQLLRRGSRLVNRVSGVLLVLTGAYVGWYGIYALRVRSDAGAAKGPVGLVTDWSTEMEARIRDTGSTTLALWAFGLLGAAALVAVYLTSRRS
jgi:cytochrome c biogenesis protein CcdA